MLFIPGTGVEFKIDLNYFISLFDIYDREESWGTYLNKYNPNDSKDLRNLFRDNLFSGKIVEQFSSEHKYIISNTLENFLLNKLTNFDLALDREHLESFGIYLPNGWKILNPRKYFIDAYFVVYEKWNSELGDAGFKLKHPNSFSN